MFRISRPLMSREKHPIDRAAMLLGITQAKLGAILGVTKAAVGQWKQEGRRVPAEHCPKIEKLTNGQVRCEELNDRVDWGYLRNHGSPAGHEWRQDLLGTHRDEAHGTGPARRQGA